MSRAARVTTSACLNQRCPGSHRGTSTQFTTAEGHATLIFSDPWAWTAQRLQERASSATPVEHVERVGGWWLRHSPTSSWRTATVLPHGAATHEKLSVLIASAEQFYREHAARSSFQLTPGACPTTLDASLAERGYYRHTPMSLQTARTADVQARP